MGSDGSTTVMGFGRPNLPTPCIEIHDCGPDGICGGPGDVDDGPPLGTGKTDPTGKFTITLSSPLTCREKIFAIDVCAMPPLVGPAFVVICIPAAPTMSPPMILVLIGILSLVGLLGLARIRWTK